MEEGGAYLVMLAVEIELVLADGHGPDRLGALCGRCGPRVDTEATGGGGGRCGGCVATYRPRPAAQNIKIFFKTIYAIIILIIIQ